MTLLELGAKLREAREARGTTVEEIAKVLKISANVLHALEEGDESNLPQAAFVRNFARAYGRHLGFSEEEMRADAFSAVADASSVSVTPPFEAVEEPTRAALPYRQMMVLIVLGVLIALLCAGGYALYANRALLQESISRVLQESPLQSGSKESPAVPQDMTAGDATVSDGASGAAGQGGASGQTAAQSSSAQSGGQSSAASTGAAEGGGQGVIVGQQPVKETADVPADSAAAATTGSATAPSAAGNGTPAAQEGNKLVISGVSRCWIRYRADDEKPIDYTVQKGGTLALAFKDRLEIQFGNVGGVRMTYNGQDMPPLTGKSTYKMVFPQSAQ